MIDKNYDQPGELVNKYSPVDYKMEANKLSSIDDNNKATPIFSFRPYGTNVGKGVENW